MDSMGHVYLYNMWPEFGQESFGAIDANLIYPMQHVFSSLFVFVWLHKYLRWLGMFGKIWLVLLFYIITLNSTCGNYGKIAKNYHL